MISDKAVSTVAGSLAWFLVRCGVLEGFDGNFSLRINFVFPCGFKLIVGGLKTLSKPMGAKRSPPVFSLSTLLFHSGVPCRSGFFVGDNLCWTVPCADSPIEFVAFFPCPASDSVFGLRPLVWPFNLCEALSLDGVFSLRALSTWLLLRVDANLPVLFRLASTGPETDRGL